MNNIKIKSCIEDIYLDTNYIEPTGNIKAIVVILHGMSEHKERYNYFLEKLANKQYLPVIYDHRGHGKSLKNSNDLGYFYSDNADTLSEDTKIVINYFQKKYPHIPVILFAHSMGTLIARNFISTNDDAISKLILCGPPTKNGLVDVGLSLAKLANTLGNPRKTNKFLNKLTFSSFNNGYQSPNEWLSKSKENVKNYNNDPLCGFTFTTNGFLNLYTLQKNAFIKRRYQVKNPDLPIFLIAGTDDPVIKNSRKIQELVAFLNDLSYNNTEFKLYQDLRHELLQEDIKDTIIQDILEFMEK